MKHQVRKPYSIAAGLLLLCAAAALGAKAQTPDWRIERLHTPSSTLQRLSVADRAIVLKLLRPELGPLFQGEATSVADEAIQSFRAERLKLGGVWAVAVQPNGGELCGASGNCSFWIVDLLHRRVLLRTVNVQSYAVEPAKPRALPEIITASRDSAAAEERVSWVFVNSRYEPESCATIAYLDENGTQLSQPKLTSHPCSSEGN